MRCRNRSSSSRQWTFAFAAIFCASFLLGCGLIPGASIEVEIQDQTPFHVFRAGEPFAFDILPTITSGEAPEDLAYQWRDFRGDPLGPIVPLTIGTRTRVKSPSDSPKPGYYGLFFLPDKARIRFNEATGMRREIGFVVLPPKSLTDRPLDPDSPFGIIHADLGDPHLPTWVKTMTWNTTAAKWWQREMQSRRDSGFQELPIVSGAGWVSDDSTVVSLEFIAALQKKFRSYIEADPVTKHWELGREENLRSRFKEPQYFANLAAKATAIRDVSQDVRLLYQVGGRSLSAAKAFFASEAADDFDIFAPHPYAWPDFPPPEEWLEDFIDERRDAMRQYGVSFPMWFTEIGAPQNDARVSQMRSGDQPVRGHSRDENASYLVKTHVISLAKQIEKIFWYNYMDRDPDTTDVEDHFGLLDYWHFPKPAYAAYVNMLNCLQGKTFREQRLLAGDVYAYEFANDDQRCIVVWTYPARRITVPLSSIVAGLSSDNVISLTDTVGTPMEISETLVVDGFPALLKTFTDFAER